jgi:hypothetical protein
MRTFFGLWAKMNHITDCQRTNIGIQLYNSPFTYVHEDPDMVSVQRQSYTRMEYIDILFAGYDG